MYTKDKPIPIMVDKKIKPIASPQRELFDIVLGGDYYVSFEDNIAYKCKVVRTQPNSWRIWIAGGPRILCLHVDEIGRTPEEAIQNQVVYNFNYINI